jgi:hypothetical protein
MHTTYQLSTKQLPMGCAVQLHQISERRATWAANLIDGWYLHTSSEHYQCHVINVKRTKSKQVSDTVFFKTKYITQPTLIPADTITKALNNLTQALKGKNNTKGLEKIEALRKIDEFLNAKPPQPTKMETNLTPETRHVTFNETTKPPRETVPSPRVNTPTQQARVITPIAKANVLKPIIEIPPPRTANTHPIIPRMLTTKKTNNQTPSYNGDKFRQYLRSKTIAQISQQSMQLRQDSTHSEQAQMIHDKETGQWLNYRQLLRNPKHKEIWTKSAANEFGQLANGVGG